MVKDAKVLAALPPRDAGEERGETSPWAEDLPEDWNAARKLLTQYSKIPEDEVADHVRAVVSLSPSAGPLRRSLNEGSKS